MANGNRDGWGSWRRHRVRWRMQTLRVVERRMIRRCLEKGGLASKARRAVGGGRRASLASWTSGEWMVCSRGLGVMKGQGHPLILIVLRIVVCMLIPTYVIHLSLATSLHWSKKSFSFFIALMLIA